MTRPAVVLLLAHKERLDIFLNCDIIKADDRCTVTKTVSRKVLDKVVVYSLTKGTATFLCILEFL